MSDLLLPTQCGGPDPMLWGGWVGPEQLQGPSLPWQNPPQRARMRQAAKDFESVLLRQLLDSMRQSIPDGGLFQSPAGRQIEGLFWHYLSRSVADNGGIGLWRDIYKQFADAQPDRQTDKPQGIK